jgi:outer membrane protein OmpA-like peptidoglycan-associated protein
MRSPDSSAEPRLLPALALMLALGCVGAPGAWAQGAVEQAAPTGGPGPSGGPAAAQAHPWRAAGKPGLPPAIPAKLPAVIVPTAPPAAPVLPPPIVVPTRPPPPTPPAPVAPDAPGAATTSAEGLRVTFGQDRTDLNPESDAAITALAHAAPTPDATFTLTAFASGGDDPSTPRRLSLSRALAVRSALMQAGIASVRIYVKALGASSPAIAEGPPDRVDIVVGAGQLPATNAPAPAGAPAAAPAPTQKADP